MESVSRRALLTGACALLLAGKSQVPAVANPAIKKLPGGKLSVKLKDLPALSTEGGAVRIGSIKGVHVGIARIANNDLIDTFWKWPDYKTEKVLRVEVMAQQWMWSFRYTGPDGQFSTADDVITNNDLRVPVGTKILFHLTSKDVIHSFFVPSVRLKVDTIPGRVTRVWWDANRPGVYDIACAEMCGTNHYLMKARLTVYTEDDFNIWLKSSELIAASTNDPTDANLAWGWKWEE